MCGCTRSGKKRLKLASLAKFYSFWPGELSPTDLLTLETNKDAVWAQQQLNERGRLTSKAVYVLTMLATHGDKEKAQAAWLNRYEAELKAGGDKPPDLPDFD